MNCRKSSLTNCKYRLNSGKAPFLPTAKIHQNSGTGRKRVPERPYYNKVLHSVWAEPNVKPERQTPGINYKWQVI